MGTAMVARHRKLLISLVLLIIGLVVAGSALAQNGACPGNTYLLGIPAQTWPANLNACAYDLQHVAIYNEPISPPLDTDRFPCSQQIHIDERYQVGEPTTYLVYVPSSGQFYGPVLRFKALLFTHTPTVLGGNIPPGDVLDEAVLKLQYFNSSGYVVWGANRTLVNSYGYIDTFYEDPIGGIFEYYYYRVYLVEEQIPVVTGNGGFIRLEIDFTNTIDKHAYLASVRFGSIYDNMPAHCPIPNASLPMTPTPPVPTPTLPATWTPNPSATATPTPITTPGATSPGITPFPTWTPSPYSFVTVPAESTPTPWPPVSIPTISWPTLEPTIIQAAATLDDTTLGLGELAEAVNDDWNSSLTFGQEAADPSNPASTGGVIAPNTIVEEIGVNLGKPISYVKAIGTYMPNSAPYIAFLILVAIFIIFNMVAKIGLSISARLFELIRRIWEAIPLN